MAAKIIIQHSIHQFDWRGHFGDKTYVPMNRKKILNSYSGRHCDHLLHLFRQYPNYFLH